MQSALVDGAAEFDVDALFLGILGRVLLDVALVGGLVEDFYIFGEFDGAVRKSGLELALDDDVGVAAEGVSEVSVDGEVVGVVIAELGGKLSGNKVLGARNTLNQQRLKTLTDSDVFQAKEPVQQRSTV